MRIKKLLGLTLIELMVTLAVLSVFVLIAAPNMQNLVSNNRQVTNINAFAATLNFARSEAIKTGSTVFLCASTNATAALPNCNTSAWERGWVVFVDDPDGDPDTGTTGNLDNTDTIVRQQASLPPGQTLRTNPAGGRLISYTPRGFINNPISFKSCDTRGANNARALNISTVGRVSIAVDTDEDGTVNLIGVDDDNNPIEVTCP